MGLTGVGLLQIGRVRWFALKLRDLRGNNIPRKSLSIQQTIWSSLGGLVDYETKKKLGDRLGWRKEGRWLNYDQLNFGLEPNAPLGHLPVHWLIFEENLCYPVVLLSDSQKSLASWRVGNWLLWQLHLVLSKV